ncbi:MAG: YbaK/EbsC family protein [Candidatus Limnocylindrus sp.]
MDLAKRRAFTERVITAGRDAGVDVRPHAMDESTATAAQAAAALGVEVGQIVKSLVFSIEGRVGTRGVLCLVSGADRVDLTALRGALNLEQGKQVRRATADEARAFTGFVIGGIPPFGHTPAPEYDAPIVLADVGLSSRGELWAACGTHLDVFPIRYDALLRAAGAREVSVSERPA